MRTNSSVEMDYNRYIKSRMLDISYVRGRLQRLFAILSDRDYDAVQQLLLQAEAILRKYLTGEG